MLTLLYITILYGLTTLLIWLILTARCLHDRSPVSNSNRKVLSRLLIRNDPILILLLLLVLYLG